MYIYIYIYILQKKLVQCDDTTSLIEENKARIKEIQEQYMKRADEINIMLTEKHKEEVNMTFTIYSSCITDSSITECCFEWM